MSSKTVYLDYAAATPLDKRVFKAMQPYFTEQFYNPSAPYQPAREVRLAIENSRASIARILGARPAEIIFTAGATESINLAFAGILKNGGHCVVNNIEHLSVLEVARFYDHSLTHVDKKGRVIMDSLENAIRDDTRLVSIGIVNNEIGTMQDVKQIVKLLNLIRKNRRAKKNQIPLYFHTDASQAAGFIDLSVTRLGVDLLTLGGDKIYGPKQTGLLYKAATVKLKPLIQGSGQEQSLRSGTENVAGIIGLAKALELAVSLRQSETKRLEKLKNIFIKQLVDFIPGTVSIGDQKHTSPHIIMAVWAGLDGERLVFRLEHEGILVNTGAACSAKKEGHSHVLKALGINPNLMGGSLRFSFGRETSEKDVLRAAKIIAQAIKQERENDR